MKLSRFGVVSSPDGRRAAWQRACLDGLDAAGCGRPAWALPGDRDAPASWLWRAYVGRPFQGRRGEKAADWWGHARVADRSPVDFVLCFATPPTAIATLDPPPFGVWRFEVPGGPPIGWRAATQRRLSVRA